MKDKTETNFMFKDRFRQTQEGESYSNIEVSTNTYVTKLIFI